MLDIEIPDEDVLHSANESPDAFHRIDVANDEKAQWNMVS